MRWRCCFLLLLSLLLMSLLLQGNSPLQEPENLEVLSRTLDKIYARQVSCSTELTAHYLLNTGLSFVTLMLFTYYVL
jgi:hypothetical protein